MAVVRKTRAVSTRDASRRLSQLLDEIADDESAILIVRYGRPAAMLIPFEESGQAMKLPRISELVLAEHAVESEEADEDLGERELDPNQVFVLLDIARCVDEQWRIDRIYQTPSRSEPGALLAALTRLELARLVERTMYGALLTRKGRLVAARLDSET